MSPLKQAVLFAVVPIVGLALLVAGSVELAVALPLLILLAGSWSLFVLQLLSGRTGRAFMAYGRMRTRALGQPHPDEGGARRTLGPAARRRPDKPRLAWSHDGWAHSDGHLAGLELLGEWFDITAFGCESRWRGEPPVPLELLPAQPYGPGLRLAGLEERLREFDVVWAGGPFEGTTWQALDARRAGGPAVVCLEVENIVGNYVGPEHEMRRRPLREVDHFCATSSTAAALLMLDGVEPERISLVPMVVDMPRLAEDALRAMRRDGRSRYGAGSDDVLAVYLGRLIPDKGVGSLIGALAWARRWPGGTRLRLVVAGEGESAAELRDLAHHYGLQDVVRFIGPIEPAARRELLAAADLVCLPSLAVPNWLEQFGRVIPEAFAFGVPVVGSASGAIPEVVGDAGRIVPPGDFGALAGTLLELTRDDDRSELARRARDRASLYSPEAFASRMRAALERAMEHRRSATPR